MDIILEIISKDINYQKRNIPKKEKDLKKKLAQKRIYHI